MAHIAIQRRRRCWEISWSFWPGCRTENCPCNSTIFLLSCLCSCQSILKIGSHKANSVFNLALPGKCFSVHSEGNSISADDFEVRETPQINNMTKTHHPWQQARFLWNNHDPAPCTIHWFTLTPPRVMKLYTWRPPFTSVPWLPWSEHVAWGAFLGLFWSSWCSKNILQ